MPQLEVTSRSGRSYLAEVPEGTTLTPELEEFFRTELDKYENPTGQGVVGTAVAGLAQGAVSAVSEPIRGAGAFLQSDTLMDIGKGLKESVEYTLPIAEVNQGSKAAEYGQAIGQGAGQLAIVAPLLYARQGQAATMVPRGLATLSGFAQGYDEAVRLGIDPHSPAGYALMGGGGGAELLSESMFGLGSKAFTRELVSDVPNILRRGAASTWWKRAGVVMGQEGLEEPVAGALHSAAAQGAARLAGITDPSGGRSLVTGEELPQVFDWGQRLKELELGMVGATAFGVMQAARTDADKQDVYAYRARVDKARRAGTVAPESQAEVDEYDKKAADFLEAQGVEDMKAVLDSNLNGTSQGVVELRDIINNPSATPAAKAAAFVKLGAIVQASRDASAAVEEHLAGKITRDELKQRVPEFENINPYSRTNQQKALDKAAQASQNAPVVAAVQNNVAAGNPATAAALAATSPAPAPAARATVAGSGARAQATALRRQAAAAMQAPAATQAPTATPAPTATTPAPASASPSSPTPQNAPAGISVGDTIIHDGVERTVADVVVHPSNGKPVVSFVEEPNKYVWPQNPPSPQAPATTPAPATAPAPTPAPVTRAPSPFRRNVAWEPIADDAVQQTVQRFRDNPPQSVEEQLDQVVAEEELHARGLSDKTPGELAQMRQTWADAADTQDAQKWKAGVQQIVSNVLPDHVQKLTRAVADQDFEAAEQHLSAIGKIADRMENATLPAGDKVRERIKSKLTDTERKAISDTVQSVRELHRDLSQGLSQQADAANTPVARAVANRVAGEQPELPLSQPPSSALNAGKKADKIQPTEEETQQSARALAAAQRTGSADALRALKVADDLSTAYRDAMQQIGNRVLSEDELLTVGSLASAVNFIENRVSSTGDFTQADAEEFSTNYPQAAKISGAVAKFLSSDTTAAEAADELDFPETPADVSPETEQQINEAFDQVEQEKQPAEPTAAPEPEPSPAPADELAALQEQLKRDKEAARKARERARQVRQRMGILPDPKEQAYADARVFSAHLKVGVTLLKLGYSKFKVWATKFLEQLDGDEVGILSLRRIYRMLRDAPASASELTQIPASDISKLMTSADPANVTNSILLGDVAEKKPGFFGDFVNVVDWAGNSVFFEGRTEYPGVGRSHRIYLEPLSKGEELLPVYRITYVQSRPVERAGKRVMVAEVVYTGDAIGRTADGNWVFQPTASQKQREDRLRMYTTTLLDAPFNANRAAPEQSVEVSGAKQAKAQERKLEAAAHAERIREALTASQELSPTDNEGRLAFNTPEHIARWAAAARWVDGEIRLPLKAELSPTNARQVDVYIATPRRRTGAAEVFSEVVPVSAAPEPSVDKPAITTDPAYAPLVQAAAELGRSAWGSSSIPSGETPTAQSPSALKQRLPAPPPIHYKGTVVASFVKLPDKDYWVLAGSEPGLTPRIEELQNRFSLVGFQVTEPSGKKAVANAPAKVVKAWTIAPKPAAEVEAGEAPDPLTGIKIKTEPQEIEPPFGSYEEFAAWVKEKRLKQGHALYKNLVSAYLSYRNPNSPLQKKVKQALDEANKAAQEKYPAEAASASTVVWVEDKDNVGRVKARFVETPTGRRPMFTNDAFESAVQINMGQRPVIPANFTGEINPQLKVRALPDGSREVVAANTSSGTVSNAGDHKRLRRKDPQIRDASFARMQTEDEIVEATVADHAFVDGLPRAARETDALEKALEFFRRFERQNRGGSSVMTSIDRGLITGTALAMMNRQMRLVQLRPIIEATGYAAGGRVIDATKLPQAIAAVRQYISERRDQAARQREVLRDENLYRVNADEAIMVLPDRLPAIIKAAVNAEVLLKADGTPNYWAYYNRASKRLYQKFKGRELSGAAPEVVVQYVEEGAEQTRGPEDEEQLAAQMAEQGLDSAEDEAEKAAANAVAADDETIDEFVEPQKEVVAPKQLTLFGELEEAAEDTETEETVPVEDDPEETSPMADEVSGDATPANDPILNPEPKAEIPESREATLKARLLVGNPQTRRTMNRILVGVPAAKRDAILVDPVLFQHILDNYYSMRKALIRAGIITSNDLVTLLDTINLVAQNRTKLKGTEALFPQEMREIMRKTFEAKGKSRFFALPSNGFTASSAKLAEELGLVHGNPDSAIAALERLSKHPEVPEAMRLLLANLSGLPAVKGLRQFSVMPATRTRGLFFAEARAINYSPQQTAADAALTLGHEFAHLALENAFEAVERGKATDAQKKAVDTLTKIREELRNYAVSATGSGFHKLYGNALSSNREFTATLMSDPAFNAWVSNRPKTFLEKLVDVLRRLIGLKGTTGTAHQKAWKSILLMSESPDLFSADRENASLDILEYMVRSAEASLEAGAEIQDSGVHPLFLGENAELANGELLSVAKEMDAEGATMDETFETTGWWKAPTDGKWRFEISDKAAKFRASGIVAMKAGKTVPLGQVFNHKLLFDNYPGVEKVGVRMARPDEEGAGDPTAFWSPSENAFVFSASTFKNGMPSKQIFVHEIQHWVQDDVGFLSGATSEEIATRLEEMVGRGVLEKVQVPPFAGREAYLLYRLLPGEKEASLAEMRAGLSSAERRAAPPFDAKVSVRLRDGFFREETAWDNLEYVPLNRALESAARNSEGELGYTLSTERDTPAWYDNRTKSIKVNPVALREETYNFSDTHKEVYLDRVLAHEEIHARDLQSATSEDYADYEAAMTERDFRWIADMYYVDDPAGKEFALGLRPGMTEEQKQEQRTLLIAEHRRAMVELALYGETTEQFALLAATNPGLFRLAIRHIARFITRITTRMKMRWYAGGAMDLRYLIEAMNDSADLMPESVKDGVDIAVAEARKVAVPLLSRRIGNYKVGGWLTTGFLNEEASESVKKRDASVRAMEAQVNMYRDDLNAAIKKEYQGNPPTALINDALGSIENPVSPAELSAADNLRTRGVRMAVGDFLSEMNAAAKMTDAGQAAIARENARNKYRSALVLARKAYFNYIAAVENRWIASAKAKQAAAFAALSPETAKAVRRIRDGIDAMQDKLIASGQLSGRTAARISKTRGLYLTRTYQVFSENITTVTGVKRNLWAEFLRDSSDPKAAALVQAARAAIVEEVVVEKAKELRQQNREARNPTGPFTSLAAQQSAIAAARKATPHLSAADALAKARTLVSVNSAEVDTKLDDYIAQGEAMESEADVLKRRDNIHPAIQALWGVYTSNDYNAFNTLTKINMLLSSQKMAQEIYDHGKANGYIFDSGNAYIDGQRVVPLGGKGTQANRNKHGTLAGAYGPAHLAAGLQELHGNTAYVNSLWNTFRALTGYAMATKTKYSVQGTFRNFFGNTVFPLINLNIHKVLSPKAFAVVGRQLNMLAENKTRYDDYIRRLIELRVVSESAYEFRDLCREFGQEVTSRTRNAPKQVKALLSITRKIDDYAGRVHQGADDFWKVLSFESEISKIKAWEPNLSQKEAEEKAAWKIRRTLPTYTEAFYFIKKLRQQPFIAPFITFTAEMWRVAFGAVKVGLREMKEARAVGSVSMWAHGMTRVGLSLGATLALPQLIAMMGKALFDAGEEDKEDGVLNPGSGEKALARFVPEYMRDNALLRFFSRNSGNEQLYMDASYMVPHDVISKCFRAALDAAMKPETSGPFEASVDASLAFLEKFTAPVMNEQLLFGSITEAWYNYNSAYERPIFKDTDTRGDKAWAVINHIYTSALEPGTLRTGRLLMEAADGMVRDGQKIEVPNELMGIVGMKSRTLFIDERLRRNSDANKLELNKASQYITSLLRSRSTVKDSDIADGYNNANRGRMELLREVRRDYLAALQLGIPQAKAVAVLKASQLSDADVNSVVGNVYTPYLVDEQVYNEGQVRSKEMGQDRLRLYLNAVKAYPKKQPLIPE